MAAYQLKIFSVCIPTVKIGPLNLSQSQSCFSLVALWVLRGTAREILWGEVSSRPLEGATYAPNTLLDSTVDSSCCYWVGG